MLSGFLVVVGFNHSTKLSFGTPRIIRLILKANMKDQNYLIKVYLAFLFIIVVGGGLFYFNRNKWSGLLDLSAPVREQLVAEKLAQQAYLESQGLKRDPGELSYVEIVTGKDQDFSDLELLRSKDTDQDTLNDYEELYLYRTSPYLADTDGDTLSDSLEIKQGTDPLCAEGKVCGNEELSVDLAKKKQLLEQLSNAGDSLEAWQSSVRGLDLENIPADVLRQALLDGGMDELELNELSDEDLLVMYQEAKTELENISPISEETDLSDEESLRKLAPADLRALLIQQGADAVKLEQVSDEDLLYFLEESIAESQKANNE